MRKITVSCIIENLKTRTHILDDLCRKGCAYYQTEYAEYQSIKYELYEEFERCFGNHASYPDRVLITRRYSTIGKVNSPRTKVVHLKHTSVYLSTVMCSVWLVATTCRAIKWSPILLANKNIFCIKTFQPGIIQRDCTTVSVAVCTSFNVYIRLIWLLSSSCPSVLSLPALRAFRRFRFLLFLRRRGRSGEEAGVAGDIIQQPEICYYNDEDEYVEDNENGYASANSTASGIFRERADQVVN